MSQIYSSIALLITEEASGPAMYTSLGSVASNSSDWFRSLAVVRWLGGGAANNDNDARNDNRVGGFRGFHGSPRALIAGTARFYRRDTRRTRATAARKRSCMLKCNHPSSRQFECRAFRPDSIESTRA